MSQPIRFKLEIDLPPSSDYDAELIFGPDGSFFIKISNEDYENLCRKVMQQVGSYEYNFFAKSKVTRVISPQHLLSIDFGNYSSNRMKSESDLATGKSWLSIWPEGVRMTYEALESADSEIYLDESSHYIIEKNYRYHHNFPWDEKFHFEPENAVKEFIQFNKIQFLPEHAFSLKGTQSTSSVEIRKEPRLRVKHSNLTDSEVKQHIDIICALYSFYTNTTINWKYSRIYAEGKLFAETRNKSEVPTPNAFGLFSFDFHQNPLNLFENVNASRLLEHREFCLRLIDRFNYALKASMEAKFMILYSIIEQLRNHYILTSQIEVERAGKKPKLEKVKDEYEFIEPTKANQSIQEVLKQILPLVTESNRMLFESDIPDKVSFIKLMTMADQFKSYFDYTGMNPETFGLDFKKLKSLRNDIFHGKPVKDIEYLKKVNWYEHLPRMTGELMIKFFGIDDLKKIKKRKVS